MDKRRTQLVVSFSHPVKFALHHHNECRPSSPVLDLAAITKSLQPMFETLAVVTLFL